MSCETPAHPDDPIASVCSANLQSASQDCHIASDIYRYADVISVIRVPAAFRDLVTDIFEPIFQALRRAGRRNGPVPPMNGRP